MIRVALSGIGGYGAHYASALLEPRSGYEVVFAAGIDPYARSSPLWEPLQQAGVPIFTDLKECLEQTQVDVMVISSPIHLHASQTQLALAYEAVVLCEKPLAATLEEGLAMFAAQRQAGLPVGIGYQWSFSKAVQALKRDIQAGLLGRPLRLKTLVLWPRRRSYYQRNQWAGRISLPGGEYVWDSPVNNATAHYLHNMLYLLGSKSALSAFPAIVQAELYRANEIENFDSAALRVWTEQGVEVLFYTAHPVYDEIGPLMQFEFENAIVSFNALDQPEFIARFKDGAQRSYGNPNEGHPEKLWIFLSSLQDGLQPVCGIPAALGQTLCVHGIHKSAQPARFPEHLLRLEDTAGDRLVWVDGLAEAFQEAYTHGTLPGEIGQFNWAVPGEEVKLDAELEQVRRYLDGVSL
jgi:predicted dehydrogenase